MGRNITQIAPNYIGSDSRKFMEELLLAGAAALAVSDEIENPRGQNFALGIVTACAIPLSLHHGVGADEVIDAALRRAGRMSEGDCLQELYKLQELIKRNRDEQ